MQSRSQPTTRQKRKVEELGSIALEKRKTILRTTVPHSMLARLGTKIRCRKAGLQTWQHLMKSKTDTSKV